MRFLYFVCCACFLSCSSHQGAGDKCSYQGERCCEASSKMLVCDTADGGGSEQLFEQSCQPDADVRTPLGAMAELPCHCADSIFFHDSACP